MVKKRICERDAARTRCRNEYERDAVRTRCRNEYVKEMQVGQHGVETNM